MFKQFKGADINKIISLMIVALFAVSLFTGTVLAEERPCIYSVSDDYTVKKTMPDSQGPWAGEELNLYGMGQELTAVEVDREGNLYIGMSDTVRKISPEGEIIWENRRMGDWVQDLAIGPDGSVYAANENDGGLKKLSPEGKEEWEIEEKVEIFNGYMGLFVLAVETDHRGDVYASFGNEVRKLTPSGDKVWSCNRFEGKIRDIEIGPSGNIYGASQGGIIRKFSPDGKVLWSYKGRNELNAIAVDEENNVYCGGGHLRNRSYISKVNPEGREEWVKKDFFYMMLCAVSDANRNIYFGSDTLMQISPEGKITWEYTGHTDRIMGLAAGTAVPPDIQEITALDNEKSVESEGTNSENTIIVSTGDNNTGNKDDFETEVANDASNTETKAEGTQNNGIQNTQSVNISGSSSESVSEDNVKNTDSGDITENGAAGDIQISSAPGLLVYVDDEFKTKTSEDFGGAYLEGLPVGKHEIKVVKKGYNARTFTVFIKKDKTLLLEVKNLTPKIKVRQEGEEKSGKVEAKVGKIVIRTIPIDCRIGVMGQNYNKRKDKFIMEDVPYGQYRFNFNYKGRRLEYNLDLNSENTLLKVDFRKEKIFINRSPTVIAPEKQTVDQGSLMKVNLSALDPEKDKLDFSITGIKGPDTDKMENILKMERSHLKLERVGQNRVCLTWNTKSAAPGTYHFQYQVADDNFDDRGELVVVVEENIPPVVLLDYTLNQKKGWDGGPEKQLQISGLIDDQDDTLGRVIFEWGDGKSTTITDNFDEIKLNHLYNDYGSYVMNIIIVYESGEKLKREKNVKVENRPPQVEVIEDRDVLAGGRVNFDIHLDDPDGDALKLKLLVNQTFGGTGQKLKEIPDRMQLKRIENGHYRFSWKTDPEDMGIHGIIYSVEDGYNKKKGKFRIIVRKNEPPAVQLAVSSKKKEAVIKGAAVDPEGQIKRVAVDWGDGSRDSYKSGDINPDNLSLRHQYEEYGEYKIIVTAYDTEGLHSQFAEKIRIQNRAPLIKNFSQKDLFLITSVGEQINVPLNGFDKDGDHLEFSIADPVFISVSSARLQQSDKTSAEFLWTPEKGDEGLHKIPVKVEDGEVEVTENLKILVKSSSREGGNLTIKTRPAECTVKIDGNTLNKSRQELLIRGLSYQEHDITFYIKGEKVLSEKLDFNKLLDEMQVDLEQREIVYSPRIISENDELKFKVRDVIENGFDSDVEAASSNLIYSAAYLPQGAEFDSERGVFRWTPDYDQAGEYKLKFKVKDGNWEEEIIEWVVVKENNRAPEFKEIEDQLVYVKRELNCRIEAVDPDGDKVHYQVKNLPSGAKFDEETGKITWRPGKNDTGEYDIRVSALSRGKKVTDSFQVEVKTPLIEMVTVPAGTTSKDNGHLTLNYDIEMGKYEVTHAEYIKFLKREVKNDNGHYKGKHLVKVYWDKSGLTFSGKYMFRRSEIVPSADSALIFCSWYGAIAYCNWLSEQEGLEPAYHLEKWRLKDKPENLEGYRLPTKKEWEYAARGGKNGKYTVYAGGNKIHDVAWGFFGSNSVNPVGQKKPNELGIFDMSGNASEWVNDARDSNRILCGGSWGSLGYDVEVDSFYHKKPSTLNQFFGFRPCRTTDTVRPDDLDAEETTADESKVKDKKETEKSISDSSNNYILKENWEDGIGDKWVVEYSEKDGTPAVSREYSFNGQYSLKMVDHTGHIRHNIKNKEPLNINNADISFAYNHYEARDGGRSNIFITAVKGYPGDLDNSQLFGRLSVNKRMELSFTDYLSEETTVLKILNRKQWYEINIKISSGKIKIKLDNETVMTEDTIDKKINYIFFGARSNWEQGPTYYVDDIVVKSF